MNSSTRKSFPDRYRRLLSRDLQNLIINSTTLVSLRAHRRRSRKLSQLGSDELSQRLAVSSAGPYFGPAFDGSVVLFQDIIEVLYRTVLTILLKGTFGFELRDRQRTTCVLVATRAKSASTSRSQVGSFPVPIAAT
jgi:hypothetical protein